MRLRANAEIDIARGVVLHDLQIGEKKYKLEIESNGFDGLNLRFLEGACEGAFTIHIDKSRGLRLSREIIRPNHDHNDHQDMRIDDGVPRFCDKEYRKKGSLQYSERELAWFEFGPTKADY